MRRRIITAVVILAIAAAGAAIVFAVPRLPDRGAAIPTAKVVKGPLSLTVHATGDLRAGRTMTLTAPPVGGMLRVVQMVTTGAAVKKGDAVVEFDPADQQFALNQAKTEVEEAAQEIVKMKADAAAQAAQDQVALLTARFDVRRAELDVSGNEFIGAIDAKKNELSLEEARRRLAQLEEDVKSRAETNKASLAVVEEKRNKAALAMQRAQSVIESLKLTAPMDGIVMVKENRDAMGGMMIWGMPMPEYRAGDSVWPGRPIVDVIENGRMELRAKVDENDRPNLTEGQDASVAVDTIPGKTFKAKVGALSGQARRSDWEGQTVTRQFDLAFQFVDLDPRMKAGASAQVRVDGRQIADALTVPRQAVFQKAGKTHVFAKNGERFEQREVKIVQRTESRAVIEGLAEGTEIALIDPTVVRTPSSAVSASPVLGAGGGK
ncbi:MAG TPA: HlyD family efflux transporter periplasmic adaptor subunit [Vicinamibacterales bacterium]|nr:HlyD family efflux transporter periplasmic adaptor subunit [Vicinamibacterales bacterium]